MVCCGETVILFLHLYPFALGPESQELAVEIDPYETGHPFENKLLINSLYLQRRRCMFCRIFNVPSSAVVM